MSAKKYTRGTNTRLTVDFGSEEFDCRGSSATSRCGCTATHLESELYRKLQILRNRAGAAITINSGYRCTRHNSYVGGAASSYHLGGRAADIRCAGLTPERLAELAQTVGFRGIGLYNGSAGRFVHVDVRPTGYLWRNTDGRNVTAATHGGRKRSYQSALGSTTLRVGSTGSGVRAVQERLDGCGYPCSIDGSFGARTAAAVRAFQTDMLLEADGVVGQQTRTALDEASR